MTMSKSVDNNPTKGEKNTVWKRNYGGTVRIISSDAYSGSNCLEFYG